jgi:hypothetical protein
MQANAWHVVSEVIACATRVTQMVSLTTYISGAIDVDTFSTIFGAFSVVGFIPHMTASVGSVFSQLTALLSSLSEKCTPMLEYVMELDVGAALEIIEEHDEAMGEEAQAMAAVGAGVAAVAVAKAAVAAKKDDKKRQGSDGDAKSQSSMAQPRAGGVTAPCRAPDTDTGGEADEPRSGGDGQPPGCCPMATATFVFKKKGEDANKDLKRSPDPSCSANLGFTGTHTPAGKASIDGMPVQKGVEYSMAPSINVLTMDHRARAKFSAPPGSVGLSTPLPLSPGPGSPSAMSPRPGSPVSQFSMHTSLSVAAPSNAPALVIPAPPPLVHLGYAHLPSPQPPSLPQPDAAPGNAQHPLVATGQAPAIHVIVKNPTIMIQQAPQPGPAPPSVVAPPRASQTGSLFGPPQSAASAAPGTFSQVSIYHHACRAWVLSLSRDCR